MLAHLKKYVHEGRYGLILIALLLIFAFVIGRWTTPQWSVEKTVIEIEIDDYLSAYFVKDGEKINLNEAPSFSNSPLFPSTLNQLAQSGQLPHRLEAYVYEIEQANGRPIKTYYHVQAKKHWGIWSFFPALVAILLCWWTREPISSLFIAIVCGAFILGKYDIVNDILIVKLMRPDSAGIIVLYLWLLGALMGIWAKTGAAMAFAHHVAARWVTGPKSAKFTAWILGVLFFQGGTLSTVLTGTTAKPICDHHRVSHEELAYIVDATASPVASQIPLNAWPAFMQPLLFVTGVNFLATHSSRLSFYLKSLPLNFYAWLTIGFTLLFALDINFFKGKKMSAAIQRSRETGELDDVKAESFSRFELSANHIAPGYRAGLWEFALPLIGLIGISIWTFIQNGKPQVGWALGGAILIAGCIAILKGLPTRQLVDGVNEGIRGICGGVIVLLLAIIIGSITQDAGGSVYILDLLAPYFPYWLLPACLFLIAGLISFCTGTSWGTYAVILPVALPLAWDIGSTQGLLQPEWFLMLSFSAILSGGVFGDQCSPISDTTVLTSISTGCDVMDHVKTQLPISFAIAGISLALWTVLAVLAI